MSSSCLGNARVVPRQLHSVSKSDAWKAAVEAYAVVPTPFSQPKSSSSCWRWWQSAS